MIRWLRANSQRIWYRGLKEHGAIVNNATMTVTFEAHDGTNLIGPYSMAPTGSNGDYYVDPVISSLDAVLPPAGGTVFARFEASTPAGYFLDQRVLVRVLSR